MGIFDSVVSFFTSLFGDDDDGGDESQSAVFDVGNLEVDDEDEELEERADFDNEVQYTDEELQYVVEWPEGENTGHPTVDLESGIAYCSEAPDGILHLLRVGDDEYEIYRSDSVS